jgi:hypothetical protein
VFWWRGGKIIQRGGIMKLKEWKSQRAIKALQTFGELKAQHIEAMGQDRARGISTDI